jgi:hypothetical protein
MRKENCKEEHSELSKDALGGRSCPSSSHQCGLTQLHCAKTYNTSNHRHRRHMGKAYRPHLPQQEIQRCLSVQVSSWTNSDTLKICTLVQQFMPELSEAVSGKNKIMVITKMVLNLLKQNGC